MIFFIFGICLLRNEWGNVICIMIHDVCVSSKHLYVVTCNIFFHMNPELML